MSWSNPARETRKLAGILAETTDDAIVVGMGLNVHWDVVPDALADIATACNLLSSRAVDRADVLVGWLRAFDARLDALATDAGRAALLDEAKHRSATLGQRVRVELATMTLEGVATDLTEEGYLVVTNDGRRPRRQRRRRRPPSSGLTSRLGVGVVSRRGP